MNRMNLQPGLVTERIYTVQNGDSAAAAGSGTMPEVLSTPRLIGLLEGTAHQVLQPFLKEGQTSVGTMVNIRHLAATPVGMEIRLRAELLEANGRKMRFQIEAWDAVDKIMEGEHERFVIDQERFRAGLEAKNRSRPPE